MTSIVRSLRNSVALKEFINTAQRSVRLTAHYTVQYSLIHMAIVSVNIFCCVLCCRLAGNNKKAQLSLTNPRDACEKFARLT